ncbi:MAG TPA: hypothetical protein VHV83_22275, partial [Armatimonadota bacterium]|nr:hypothetical protein [Armatimonadota bacterium]
LKPGMRKPAAGNHVRQKLGFAFIFVNHILYLRFGPKILVELVGIFAYITGDMDIAIVWRCLGWWSHFPAQE